ncbi:MAG: hypothetical protein JXA93_05665 [Anaerolineae bacterium]|nr:hypothetical protein [Anaerolineae bacterium]
MVNTELEAREQLVERLVEQVRRRKLTLPALMLLDLAQPFAFLAGQGLLLCQPLLGYLVDAPRVEAYADLLTDRASVQRLLARLEDEASVENKGGVEGE